MQPRKQKISMLNRRENLELFLSNKASHEKFSQIFVHFSITIGHKKHKKVFCSAKIEHLQNKFCLECTKNDRKCVSLEFFSV